MMKLNLKAWILLIGIVACLVYFGTGRRNQQPQADEKSAAVEAKSGAKQSILQCEDCPQMIILNGNSNFLMGDDHQEQSELDRMLGMVQSNQAPRHSVNIRSFALGRTEVTQEEWSRIMGNNPSPKGDQCSNCPVTHVSMQDIDEFISRLNVKTGKIFRLPTEAEWEYAAMGDHPSDSHFFADLEWMERHAWSSANSKLSLHSVGSKDSNDFGVHDLLGNVWEWVQDCYHPNYKNAPTNGEAWLDKPKELFKCESESYVVRGGSSIESKMSPRRRGSATPDRTGADLGFRLAMTL